MDSAGGTTLATFGVRLGELRTAHGTANNVRIAAPVAPIEADPVKEVPFLFPSFCADCSCSLLGFYIVHGKH